MLTGFVWFAQAQSSMQDDPLPEGRLHGTLQDGTNLRSSKYLSNVIGQDQRGIKLRLSPMLGFKRLRNAAIVINGIDFLRSIH
jgi:transposase-like protein